MSIINNQEQKPIFNTFTHISELVVNSKKASNIQNIEKFRKNKIYDPKECNLEDSIDEDINIEDFNGSKNSNPFSFNNKSSINIAEKEPKNNNMGKRNNSISNQQKGLLANKKNEKNHRKTAKNAKGKKNKRNNTLNSSNMNSSLYRLSKSSDRSNSSANSTKRSKIAITPIDLPEMHPEEYDYIDSSSDEDVKINDNNNFGLYNNNKNNRQNFLNKKIMEKANILENQKIKEEIEQKLNGFDLISLDAKSMYKDTRFKKKYLKNIVDEIEIKYFDKEQVPIHAIFVFHDKNGNNNSKEKIIFPGGYDKDEFIRICENTKNNSIKVELLADFAELGKNSYMDWMKPNNDLFIDFYFLINILN
jgi:hypothetical protein